ncbi:ApeA N-terminal domain 1-containing protein [Novacetimonas cocois]|uniref:ApeA N-terminal domain 1-containing protein n=1 Tax=Novacetimonas cocois TaxID=1747507 RepID=UPI00197CFC55|nr:hypothetical protein [Novacetimonas cocois]
MPKTDYIPEQKQFNVELYHDQLGRLGSGVLYFGGNQWAYVALEILDKSQELSRNDAKFDLVKAITDQGTTFCLCDCKVDVNNLYADYVINGDLNEATFDTISVRYSEVSEWFLRWRVIDGSVGETLSWQKMPNDINVSVKTDEEQFDLRSKYYGSRGQRGEDLVLNEHVVFIFSAKENRFSLADVKAKSHELSCLLSILLAYPVTIANVVVSQGTSYPCRVHFPTFERPERAKDNNAFWASCFIQQPDLATGSGRTVAVDLRSLLPIQVQKGMLGTSGGHAEIRRILGVQGTRIFQSFG